MGDNARREAARGMYVKRQMSCAAIAREMGVSPSTVYKWKNADRDAGIDWDRHQRVYNLSPSEMTAMFAESVKHWLVEINESPDKLADPKIADAISKHVATMQKIDSRSQYRGVMLDLIRVINSYLAEAAPSLQDAMLDHWDAIKTRMLEYSGNTGLTT